MKNNKVYVRSRGFLQEQGYRWFENNEIVAEPDMVKKVAHLIESESFSIVLARENKELLLLVTGIDSERRDFRNRITRISVAWICEDSEANEKFLRTIASGILVDSDTKIKTIEKIEKSITVSDNTNGLEIICSHLNISNLAEINNTKVGYNQHESKKGKRFFKNSQETQNELAKELREYSLPKESDVLIVVTGIKSQAAFEKAGVWYGLSNLVDEKKSDQHKPDILSFFSWFNTILNQPKNLIVIFVVSFLFMTTGFFVKPVINRQRIQPLESQIQELKLDKTKKQDEYQQLEKQIQEINKTLDNLSMDIKNINNQLEKKSVMLLKIRNSKNFVIGLKAILHII